MFNTKHNLLEEQLSTSGINLSITFDDVGDFFGDVGDTVGNVLTGGALDSNRQAAEQAKRTNKQNKILHKFNVEEAERSNLYQVESLRIQKANNEADLQYQEQTLQAAYDRARAVQKFENQQAKRAFQKSKSEAFEQIGFNARAQKQALKDQSRYLAEQLADLSLTQRESLSDYQFAAAGVSLKRRQARDQAKFEIRKTSMAGLKAAGSAAARGQSGRSAAKVQQAIAAEVGANQAEIVQALLTTEAGIDLDLLKMNNQLNDDIAKIKLSQISLAESDKSARKKIKLERKQADMNALASVLLKPTALPPLPKPIALPRPEYQDIFESVAPPKAAKVVAPQQNLFAAGVSQVTGYASTAMSIYSTGKSVGLFKG